MIYVLDACAMVAYLNGEPGGDVVEGALLDKDSECLAHAINLCEVFYLFHRAGGAAAVAKALADLSGVGVVERNDFDSAFWRQSGDFEGGASQGFFGRLLRNHSDAAS